MPLKDNSFTVIAILLKCLQVPVTKTSIRNELAKHPVPDSLLALSDVLKQWQIANGAFPVSFGELQQVPCPFIAHLHDRKGAFVVIHRVEEAHIIVSNEKWRRFRMYAADFEKYYSGRILAAEPAPGAGEPGYAGKRRKELLDNYRLPFVVSGLCLLMISALLFNTAWLPGFVLPAILLMLFKSAGIFVSIVLLIQSIDSGNALVQRFCTGGKGSNCHAVLNSGAAKIAGAVSWSEIGFFYFAGTWLILLFHLDSLPVLRVLAILNILSLPYTFYSIWYQYRVAGQWCLLCCTVLALLWLEFIPLAGLLLRPVAYPAAGEWSSMLICLALPVLLWVLVKPLLFRLQQAVDFMQQHKRMKFRPGLFHKLLTRQEPYVLPGNEDVIVLGNPEAAQTITLVSNPYCPPCNTAHEILTGWLNGRDDIRLQVIFSVQDSINNPGSKVAGHLMALRAAGNGERLQQALHDWYGQKHKNYEAWSALYPVERTSEWSVLERQNEWCRKCNIAFTPTILINGYTIPELYHLEDIKYLV